MAKVELKQPIVQEISEQIKDAQSVVVVDYRGLTLAGAVASVVEIANAFGPSNTSERLSKSVPLIAKLLMYSYILYKQHQLLLTAYAAEYLLQR